MAELFREEVEGDKNITLILLYKAMIQCHFGLQPIQGKEN